MTHSVPNSADEIRARIVEITEDKTLAPLEKLELLKKHENRLKILEGGENNVNAVV